MLISYSIRNVFADNRRQKKAGDRPILNQHKSYAEIAQSTIHSHYFEQSFLCFHSLFCCISLFFINRFISCLPKKRAPSLFQYLYLPCWMYFVPSRIAIRIIGYPCTNNSNFVTFAWNFNHA
jgi:hypothetical protein